MLDRVLTDSSLVSVAADVAARCTTAAGADRRLDPDVVNAVLKAGFARHFVPTNWDGNAGTFGELMRAVVAVGEACASTAWLASS